MHVCHLPGMVKPHPRFLRPPHIDQQNDSSAEGGHRIEVQRAASSSILDVYYVAAGPSGICADGQGGEGQQRGFIWFGYEWSVYENLRLVIMGV